jgi:hypothetical protein
LRRCEPPSPAVIKALALSLLHLSQPTPSANASREINSWKSIASRIHTAQEQNIYDAICNDAKLA